MQVVDTLGMKEVQASACRFSGVSQAEAFIVDEVNLFERLGQATFVALSTEFYNRVYSDEESWFRDIFAGSKKEDAIQNQFEFLIQRLGGPALFSQRKGHPALIGRHMTFDVQHRGATKWLAHMQAALDSLAVDEPDSTVCVCGHKNSTSSDHLFCVECGVELSVPPAPTKKEEKKEAATSKFHGKYNGRIDADSNYRLMNFFKHTAYFLVAGLEMSKDRRRQQQQAEEQKSTGNIFLEPLGMMLLFGVLALGFGMFTALGNYYEEERHAEL